MADYELLPTTISSLGELKTFEDGLFALLRPETEHGKIAWHNRTGNRRITNHIRPKGFNGSIGEVHVEPVAPGTVMPEQITRALTPISSKRSLCESLSKPGVWGVRYDAQPTTTVAHRQLPPVSVMAVYAEPVSLNSITVRQCGPGLTAMFVELDGTLAASAAVASQVREVSSDVAVAVEGYRLATAYIVPNRK